MLNFDVASTYQKNSNGKDFAMCLFKKEEVPPVLWQAAEKLNREIEILKNAIKARQESCNHQFAGALHYDKNYSPYLDNRNVGAEVIKNFICTTCSVTKPIGPPNIQCWKCGGKMQHDRTEQFGMDRAHIHKCEECGHEYDTT